MITLVHEIYTGLLAQLSNNTVLVAGVGTVLAGAALAICRNVPSKIFHVIKSLTTLTLTMHTRNTDYHYIADFLNTVRINATSRNFSLSKKTGTPAILIPNNDSKNKLKSSLILGYGASFGFYKGTFLIMDKIQLQNKDDIEDQVTITFLTRNKTVIQNFINDSMKNDNTNIKISVSSNEWFGTPMERSKRPMESVFINDNTKESILESITKFRENKKWYTTRGIPYKHCIALCGKPGTGKTSLIHALASKLDMDIKYISDLENISTLLEEVSCDSDLVVVEDIDSLAQLNREDIDETSVNKKDDKKIIHNLLNVLDGFKTPEGMILIITTNHIEKLDEALKRSGRIDKLIEISELNQEAMRKMYISFYGEEHKDILDKFLECGTYKTRTGADLQQLFLTHDAVDVLTYLE